MIHTLDEFTDWEQMKNKVICGDALELLRKLPDNSVDMILCDLPYGTTENKWDIIIDPVSMFLLLDDKIKEDGAIVLTAIQPFTSVLVSTAEQRFKYSLVWKKTKIQHFAQAPYRYLTEHEDILVFSKAGTAENAKVRMKYNPQGLVKVDKFVKGKKANNNHRPRKTDQKNYKQEYTNYPKSILEFESVSNPDHPTQKPVSLFRYLIQSFSNKGDLVCDMAMGSFTTAKACQELGRDFIGCDLELDYCKIGERRLSERPLFTI